MPDVVPIFWASITTTKNAPVYKFNTSATSFRFGDPDFPSGRDILMTGGQLLVFFDTL